MNIIIGADIVPTEDNEKLFEQGKLTEILGEELYKILSDATYRIFNLEAPITNYNKPIDKFGPALKINSSVLTGLKKLNPTFLLLSNNHIMDFGEEGYKDTIKILDKENIDYIGVGDSKKQLNKNYILNMESKKIAFYNCCETEFSIAGENSSGANQFDLLNSLDDIRELKKKNDYVIILYHGGKEYYRYPSPELKQKCEKMIDVGADLVICQHSHCIGCEQNYKNGKIIYGQGNFIFNNKNIMEERKTSLLVNIKENFKIEYIPIMKTQYGTRLANNEETNLILNEFYKRSELIKNNDFVVKEYSKLTKIEMDKYLKSLRGKRSILFKALDKITHGKLIKHSYSKENLLGILNYVECETHRELLINVLKEAIDEKNKESN